MPCLPIGCTKPDPKPEEKTTSEPSEATVQAVAAAEEANKSKMAPPKVAVIFYSMYGHIYESAKVIQASLEANGCEVKLLQVAETLPEEVLTKMGAPPKPEVPIATPNDLASADGIMLGIPTRYGAACAQMKAFWDSTGSLWQEQALAGKPAGIFFSTGTQAGGQETTALTWLTQFVHQGMVYVPLGYQSPDTQFNMDEVHGGSPYGSGVLAGPDGSRKASDLENKMATKYGEVFATTVKKLTLGAEALKGN